ncbi:MAG: hypothetical protein H6751_02140 [Candidatus Omnitrophica bacterium]|nr:hypothetical protein [Candidatus Omnitrophota bacterium]
MKRDWKKTLLFTLITLVILMIPIILLAEWGARIRYRMNLYQETEEAKFVSIYRKSDDPVLVYEMKPGSEEPGKEPGVMTRINEEGFRDDPFDLDEDRDSFRIVALGDSVAWGFGVDTQDAFLQLLEGRLNEGIPDASPPIEIFNLGVMGYSTGQEVRLLETRGLDYKPDLVMVIYVLNDPDEVDGGLARYFDPPKIYLWDAFQRFRRWWAADRMGRSGAGGYPEVIHRLYWEEVMANLDRLQKVSQEAGVPVLMVQMPAFRWKGEDYPDENLEKQLAGEFKKRGFYVHALWPVFRGTDAEALSFDPWHPTEEGHRMIAEDLQKYLRGTGLAPSPPNVETPDSSETSLNGTPRQTGP